jgi:predicted nucleic acid-binding protein
MARPTAFIDSSVIIGALLSSEGGSFHILSQCHDLFAFQVNEYALAEIQAILHGKFTDRPSLVNELFLLLGIAGVFVLPNPTKRDVNKSG